MENAIVIYPNSKEDTDLYKKLAKRLNNRFVYKKRIAATKEQKLLDDLSESIQEMKLHEEGKIHLKSAKDLLDEL